SLRSLSASRRISGALSSSSLPTIATTGEVGLLGASSDPSFALHLTTSSAIGGGIRLTCRSVHFRPSGHLKTSGSAAVSASARRTASLSRLPASLVSRVGAVLRDDETRSSGECRWTTKGTRG